MKGTLPLAAFAVLAALGGVPLAVAQELPEECRRQCSLDLQDCRKACIDNRDYDGCQENCHSDLEDCLSDCRESRRE